MPNVGLGLSEQQKDVVRLPADPFVVSACAGSGKTKTAVHRIAELAKRMGSARGRILLLSFSNVAVETFQREYGALTSGSSSGKSAAVEIDTVDGFLTKNLVRPHGHLVMGCHRCPFLVEGQEPFLKSFTVWDGEKSLRTSDLRITLEAGRFVFRVGKWAGKVVDTTRARESLGKLGAVGAYTHESARYWAYQLLWKRPFLLRAIAKRYQQIIVDEAQDIGTLHQALLEKIASAGSNLSLIGDVKQGIFEFTGATGEFLSGYDQRPGVQARPLETNYRSVPPIVEIANRLSGRRDIPNRERPKALHGAYFMVVNEKERRDAFTRFGALLELAQIAASQGVVVFRSGELLNKWSGAGNAKGQGVVKAFAAAATWRDQGKRLDLAFVHGCGAVAGLLADDHRDLLSLIGRQSADPTNRAIRREIWHFVKNPATGLPSSTLKGCSEWHPLLVSRAKSLVGRLESRFGLSSAENLGRRLSKTALPDKSLLADVVEADAPLPNFRLSTVHKVKGESLDGVMYLATKAHIEDLLAGTHSENGKIGYVALTRARNLFVLGVPAKSSQELEPALTAAGFLNAAHLLVEADKLRD